MEESNHNFWHKLCRPKCSDVKISPAMIAHQYTEADLYKKLSYFFHVFDTVSCIAKLTVEAKSRMLIEKLIKIRPMIDQAAQKIRDRCAFGWVRLHDLVITV
ncbi:hypothetical protein JHK85_012596 [Glycine max]|nr:hypothetical protein JHK85_012596 [Glycine max]